MGQYVKVLHPLHSSKNASIKWIFRRINFCFKFFKFANKKFFIIYIKYTGYIIASKNICSFIILLITPIIYLTYAHYKIDVYSKAYTNQYLFRKTWAQNQTMTNLTPIGYHIYDLYDFYEQSKPYDLTETYYNLENLTVYEWFNQQPIRNIRQQIQNENKFKNYLIYNILNECNKNFGNEKTFGSFDYMGNTAYFS